MADEYPTSHAKEADILERKAITLGWGITNDLKAKAKHQIEKMISDDDTTPRDRNIAIKTLVTMSGQDIAVALSPVTTAEETIEPVTPAALLVEMKKTIPE